MMLGIFTETFGGAWALLKDCLTFALWFAIYLLFVLTVCAIAPNLGAAQDLSFQLVVSQGPADAMEPPPDFRLFHQPTDQLKFQLIDDAPQLTRNPLQKYSGSYVLLCSQKSCAPCRSAEEVALPWASRSGWKTAVIEIDQQRELAEQLKVTSTPTFLIVRDCQLVERVEGFDGDLWPLHRALSNAARRETAAVAGNQVRRATP